MKILIVTYCFGMDRGPAMIGTYKRGLRIAMELTERGHEVAMFCTGRQFYHDDLTRRAERVVQFVEFPFSVAASDASRNRSAFLESLVALGPDQVVVCESPLAGTLLETVLCAVELVIPVVLVDNAYYSGFADYFLDMHGPMADGMILTGPSSLHTNKTPRTLCHVPPFITASAVEARRLCRETLGIATRMLITVIAYDTNVQQLGISLLEKLARKDVTALFLTAEPERFRQALAALPAGLAERVRAIAPPTEPVLFGLFQISQLVVGKIGFMQVVESLTLKTPFIGVYFKGFLAREDLAPVCWPFVHATSDLAGDAETLVAARRFLNIDAAAMREIHRGELNAAEQAVDFLENLPRRPRQNCTRESEKRGFKERFVRRALANTCASSDIEINFLRCSMVRSFPDYRIYILVCNYTVNGKRQTSRLWGRIYHSRKAALADFKQAQAGFSDREPYFFSRARGLLIERDLGEVVLSPCIPQAGKVREAEEA